VDPLVVPRDGHRLSRRDVDPDALRVLYRLQQHRYTAYLVGGSVRDLLLWRPPKDFDIGTDAHPYQIKKLFRNCWIIGRRFRLAHIKFGTKTIEVATFRRNVPDAAAAEALADAAPEVTLAASSSPPGVEIPAKWVPADHHVSGGDEPGDAHDPHGLVHRDNTFGTPEEDAFRRDFTVNALFYDVATKSVIDYVGGLEDLERGVIRSIGDPRVRFVEDPVRMFRAAVLSARLSFDIDGLVLEAIDELGHLITKASPARMLEEYFKVLRSGYAEASFRMLWRTGLLEKITPELKSPPERFWAGLAALDQYRQRFPSSPPELTNAVLIGTMLEPLGVLRRGPDRGESDDEAPRVSFGALPVARKDVDRLRQILQTLPRLADPALPPRVARGLPHRPSFPDTLTWFEIFDGDTELVSRWKAARAEYVQVHGDRRARGSGRGGGHGRPHGDGHTRHQGGQPGPPADPASFPQEGGADAPPRRRRRRRRRRGGRPPT
jgi:poly(A) polymerase